MSTATLCVSLVLEDLLSSCSRIREHAAQGRLVYDLNQKIIVGTSQWNIDLVLGPPPTGVQPPPLEKGVQRSPPAAIRIAIEAKTIMTEHGKARRNRQRDWTPHQFVHRHDPNAIAAGLTVVNIAGRFKSPLRPDVSIHRNIKALVGETMDLLRALPTRSALNQMAGLEANGAILVDHDNINLKKTRLVTTPPAPQVGDPLHYDGFLLRICDRYTQRWS